MIYKKFFELIKSNAAQLSENSNVPSKEIIECANFIELDLFIKYQKDIYSFLRKPNLYNPSEYGFDSWYDLLCNKFSDVAEYMDMIISEDECQRIYEEKHKNNSLPYIDNSLFFTCAFHNNQRIVNCLGRQGITTFRPLLSMSVDDIKMIIGIGAKSADEIIKVIQDNKQYLIIKKLEEV